MPAALVPPLSPILNPDLLEQLRCLGSGAGSPLHSVVELFATTTPPILASLREALATSNWKQLDGQSHYLKGSCASLGAERMVQCCEELRHDAEKQDPSSAARHLADLELEFKAVKPLIDAELHA